MVSGSSPVGFHRCTAKISEFRRGLIVEDALGRRVGEDAAVPIELAVDAHGGEGRRQRARRHDVRRRELHLRRVEIMHHAGAHMRGADGEPRVAAIDEREVDELFQRPAQRLGRVVAGVIGAERHMGAEKGAHVGLEETGDAGRQRRP